MINFFKITLFVPLYNLLIWLTSVLPGADLGLAIILLTILVKIVIFPLYTASVRTQIKIKSIEGKLKEIKEKYKTDQVEQSRQIMEIYKQEKINPLSSFLVILIQIPVVISLFYVFKDSFVVQKDLVYSFLSIPAQLNHNFLGFIDLTQSHNYIFAFLTGVTLYWQVNLSMPKKDKKVINKDNKNPNFSDDLMKSMDLQMRYVMPVLTAIIAFTLPTALSLYWITSNTFSAIYEALVIKKIRAESQKN